MSFPGRGRRVLNPEERPCTQAGGGAAPVPGCPAARGHQDSHPDPQGLCQKAKLEPALSNKTQSHQPLWSTAGEAPGAPRGQGRLSLASPRPPPPVTASIAAAPTPPPAPALASCPGRRSKDHNTAFPEIQSYSPDSWCGGLCGRAILPLRRPPEVQVPGYQVKAFPLQTLVGLGYRPGIHHWGGSVLIMQTRQHLAKRCQ